LIKELEA
jgi:hypothetical protein